ncbi:GNAT family N-acetyltransferase [Ensifer sp. 4252]|uniref:GNAT family N-acetyltransferase n=1 Tax=Ensifer sp. 4252 TaxID=3373915 RepID=UPI003D2289F0
MTNTDLTIGRPSHRDAHAASRSDAAMSRFEISIHDTMAPLEKEWRSLEALPFNSLHQGYDWCAAWAQAHDSALLVVRGAVAGELQFILPLEFVPGRLFNTARFLGAPHSNLNTGLFAADALPLPRTDLADLLAHELNHRLRHKVDLVALEKTPLNWRGAAGPFASLPGIKNQNSSFQLPLFSSFERTLAQVNAKRRRKKMRISERRLDAFGGYDYVIAQSPSEAQSLLDVFFRQKATRFAALGLPDVFHDARTRLFFHTLAGRCGEADDRLLELNAIRLKGERGGRIVAVAGLSRKADHVICQFGSIDEELAGDASPGELLFYRMIQRLCSEGAALFDFGVGDQPYKRSWCTIETPLRDIVLPLTVRGRFAAGYHRALVQAKVAIKANRAAYSFFQRARSRKQKPARQTGEIDSE